MHMRRKRQQHQRGQDRRPAVKQFARQSIRRRDGQRPRIALNARSPKNVRPNSPTVPYTP